MEKILRIRPLRDSDYKKNPPKVEISIECSVDFKLKNGRILSFNISEMKQLLSEIG